MIPINQVILGGGDPLLGNSMVGNSLDEQLQLIEKYKQNLEAAKQLRQQVQPAQQPISQPQRMIWDEIDAEISPMSDEQKTRMLQDEDYVDTYTKIQDMVQAEILSLVKGRIEATPEGKELLQRQLKIVKKLKEKIIQETNREMEMFRKFSKTHPEVTYEEFIKASMVTIMQLTDNLKSYISLQLESMAKTNPMIGFMKPLITRALDKNFSKISKALDLIADKDGNIDIENILTEMMENLMTTNPFTFKTSFVGDIEIGGGEIKFNLPLTNKKLVLDMTDLETFKEMLITKD